MKQLYYFLLIVVLSFSCENNQSSSSQKTAYIPKIFTQKSDLDNSYKNFYSPNAINHIAAIENEYFNDFYSGNISQYYGTMWRIQTDYDPAAKIYDNYKNEVFKKGNEPDSLHCTLYAYEGLKAGLDSADLATLEQHHKRIWKEREIAGWSIGYILVKYFGWKAYLVLDRTSHEYQHCLKSYKKEKTYPVWNQPNIPLENLYIKGKDDDKIKELLNKNEFSWGFSDQGYHTWITRFDTLKECNWAGSPANSSYSWGRDVPLFIKRSFLEYDDYGSHILVVAGK
jgi:hypothetical protein